MQKIQEGSGAMEIDFSKATKIQLYEMAANENYRLIERYAAARELQRRKYIESKKNVANAKGIGCADY
jgi:hypothetical protein